MHACMYACMYMSHRRKNTHTRTLDLDLATYDDPTKSDSIVGPGDKGMDCLILGSASSAEYLLAASAATELQQPSAATAGAAKQKRHSFTEYTMHLFVFLHSLLL